MMKRLILLVFSLFSFIFVYGQIPYSESFESDFGGWIQSTSDDFDWTRNSGTTPTDGTGPSSASDGSYYLFVEANNHHENTAIIEKAISFANTTMPILSFDYHMFGSGVGFISLKIYDGTSWTTVWNQTNEQGNQWNNVKLCLGNYADNANVKLRFTADVQYTDSSDIAIDNIEIVDFKYTSVSKTDVTCGGYSDGKIDITIDGGYGSYEYSKDNGIPYTAPVASTTHSFLGLPGGGYLLKVRDVSGCVIDYPSVNIVEPDKTGLSTNKTDVSPCVDSKNGDITITATGINSPFTYSVSGFGGPFQTSNNFTNLDTGKYQIAVKNSVGCIALGSDISIICPTKINIYDQTATDVSTCFGDCNGSIDFTVGGGNISLQYAIDTSASLTFENSAYFSALCADSYRVIIEDKSGCRDTTDYLTVNEPALLTYSLKNHTDITSCYGDETGTINLVAIGGTGTINYSVNNGTNYQSSGNFSNLPFGKYYIWARDENNCLTDKDSISITQPLKLVLDSAIYSDVSGCYGNSNGEIHIYAKGGTGTIEYSIDGESSYSLGRDFTNLDVGDYNSFVRDDNGCKDSVSTIVIEQPSSLVITNINAYDVDDCYGENSGLIQIFVNQGTPPYLYSIDNGVSYQSLFTFSNVSAGSYQIIVKDDNGCTKLLDSLVEIKQPDEIVLTDQIATDVSCHGSDDGSVFVNASGGTGSLLYSVDNSITFPYSVGTITYLPAGSYQIGVKDENGCAVNGNLLVIIQPDSLVIDSVITQSIDGCYGDSSGVIKVYAKGGTSPYNYSLDNGFSFQTSKIFDYLKAGNGYFPYIEDDNGCFVMDDQQTVGQPSQLIVSNQSHTNIDTCHGVPVGTISVSSNGGTGTVFYSIDDGANYSDNSGIFTNLYAKTYNIKIKDSKDCIANGWEEIIYEPDTLLIDSLYTGDILCNGQGNGMIYIYDSGGQPQIRYSIDGGTSFHVSSQFIGLSPGNYNILVKDSYNCQVASSTTIVEPSALILDSVNYSDVNTCKGDITGSISIYAHGGTPDIEYAYSHVSSIPANYYSSSVFSTAAGTYYVTIRDSQGCTQTSNSFIINEPTFVEIKATDFENISCTDSVDGTINITVAGGTPGYEYSIDNGATWQKNDGIYYGLAAATYLALARDTNHCEEQFASSIVISEPPRLEVADFQAYDPSCYNYTNGRVVVAPSGGTGAYKYVLNDTLLQNTNVFSNLPENKYWVTLTDINNCVAQSDTLTITMPINSGLFQTSIDSGCAPVDVTFIPDTNIGIFQWTFGDLGQSAMFSPTHTYYNATGATVGYIVTAVSQYSVCSDTVVDTISVFSQPNVYFDVDNSTHYYPDTIVDFSNISPSLLNYQWDFGDNSTFSGMNPVSHSYPNCGIFDISLIAKNIHTCSDTAFQTINMTSVDPEANFIMDRFEGCAPLSVNFTNTSSSANRYEWINNGEVFSTEINPSLYLAGSSDYLIKLKAYGYCNKYDSLSDMVYVYPIPELDFTVSPDTVSVGQDVLFQNYTTGAAYYVWSFGDGMYSGDDSPIRSYSTPGTYSVTLKAASNNSCVDSLTLNNIVFVSSEFYFKFPNAFSPDGDGIFDYFEPHYNMVEKCRVDIYSRRGQLLFRTTDFKNTFWDGTFRNQKLPIDVYFWEVYGNYSSGEYFHELGEVTLIR